MKSCKILGKKLHQCFVGNTWHIIVGFELQCIKMTAERRLPRLRGDQSGKK